MTDIMPIEGIENRILLIRGLKVMIDRDLATLYGVTTKALNQALKRNLERFPEEFVFQLSEAEKSELVTNCDRFNSLKHSTVLPLAFTEHGVAMLSCVLKSERATKTSILIIKAFVKLRQIILTHKELARKLGELEDKVDRHDMSIAAIFEKIRELTGIDNKPSKRIGFLT